MWVKVALAIDFSLFFAPQEWRKPRTRSIKNKLCQKTEHMIFFSFITSFYSIANPIKWHILCHECLWPIIQLPSNSQLGSNLNGRQMNWPIKSLRMSVMSEESLPNIIGDVHKYSVIQIPWWEVREDFHIVTTKLSLPSTLILWNLP